MTKEFDKRNAAKSRRVCEAMAEAASTGKRVLTEREKLILDMWPKFEDGEYVWFGDAYIDGRGDANKVMDVRFDDKYVCLVGVEGFHTAFIIGERVKRHVQSVLDADGVEINVGDKVWLLNGIDNELVVEEIDDESGWVGTRSANGGCLSVYNTHLTHTRPDSWELLEEDAEVNDETGIVGGNLDIVRRAKALAGVEAD